MADTEDSREKQRAVNRERQRVWREANREKRRAYHREWASNWRAANPEKAKEASRKNEAKRKAEKPPRYAYNTHRSRAKQHDILFLLTFDEWLKIWTDSGKWEERGHCKGQYVMARTGDIGPYAIGNVRICTVTENFMEAHLGKPRSAATREKISQTKRERRIHLGTTSV